MLHFFPSLLYLTNSIILMKKTKATLSTLSFEIITCIAEYLTSKELFKLSQCNKTLHQLQNVDTLWKRFCRIEFGIQYNHPNRTYRELFLSCCKTKKGRGYHKRLPCSHLNNRFVDNDMTIHKGEQKEDMLNHCQRCPKEGSENLFICITPNCHQTG